MTNYQRILSAWCWIDGLGPCYGRAPWEANRRLAVKGDSGILLLFIEAVGVLVGVGITYVGVAGPSIFPIYFLVEGITTYVLIFKIEDYRRAVADIHWTERLLSLFGLGALRRGVVSVTLSNSSEEPETLYAVARSSLGAGQAVSG